MSTTPEILNAIWKKAKSGPMSVNALADEAGINVRYAREVAGLMVTKGLLQQDPDTLEYVAVTTVNAEQVQEVIDLLAPPQERAVATNGPAAALATPAAKKASKPRPKKVKNTTGKCLCGCGTNSTSNYRPGHDARHAGQVAREIQAASTKKEQDALAGQLPSEALQAKARKMAERLAAKESK